MKKKRVNKRIIIFKKFINITEYDNYEFTFVSGLWEFGRKAIRTQIKSQIAKGFPKIKNLGNRIRRQRNQKRGRVSGKVAKGTATNGVFNLHNHV